MTREHNKTTEKFLLKFLQTTEQEGVNILRFPGNVSCGISIPKLHALLICSFTLVR